MPKGKQGFQKGHKSFEGTKKTQFKKGNCPWIKGKHHSLSTRKKIAQKNIGKKGYWKDKKRNEETKEKIRRALQGKKLPKGHPFTIKGKTPWNKNKVGVMPIPWNKGKKNEYKLPGVSKHHCGRKHPEYTGIKHWNWKGGISSQNRAIRKSVKYKKWREKVFEYDNYTCWICEKQSGKLHPHHLKSFSKYPKLRFVVGNGLTLCEFCHKTYTKFGKYQ